MTLSHLDPLSLRAVHIDHPLTEPRRKNKSAYPTTGLVAAAPGNSVPAPATPVGTDTENGVVIGLFNVPGDATTSDTASNGGGPLMVGCQLELVFWGETWQTGPNATGVSPGSVVSAVRSIVDSPYLSLLTQYGFGSVTIQGSTLVTGPPPPPNYTFDDVQNMMWNLIDDGKFPEPDEPGGRTLYMVFMPNGSNPPVGIGGEHGDMSDFDAPADVDWMWTGMVSYGTLDFITTVFSHELVEAITDPEPDSPAWQMSRTLNGGQEIGDACNNTTGRIASGVLVQAYWSQEHHRCAIPLHPAPVPSRAGAMLIQGSFGTAPSQPTGNFEVVASRVDGLGHWWRNNRAVGLPWTFTGNFGQNLGPIEASGVIQSNFGPGNLEVVALGASWGPARGQLWHFWRDGSGWHQGVEIFRGASAVGIGFIQSNLTVPGQNPTVQGDFHVVAPLDVGQGLNGGMLHCVRRNDQPDLPWVSQEAFGGDLGRLDEVVLIQSNLGQTIGFLSAPGPLELVARRADELWHFWRDGAGWHHDASPFAKGVTEGVSFIQSTFGTKGNFEVMAPLAGRSGLAHWWRNNDDPSLPWILSATFAEDLPEIAKVSLIQSNMSVPGPLEAVVQSGASLWHLWRDAAGWHHDGNAFASLS